MRRLRQLTEDRNVDAVTHASSQAPGTDSSVVSPQRVAGWQGHPISGQAKSQVRRRRTSPIAPELQVTQHERNPVPRVGKVLERLHWVTLIPGAHETRCHGLVSETL